jgi:hypothetical protein
LKEASAALKDPAIKQPLTQRCAAYAGKHEGGPVFVAPSAAIATCDDRPAGQRAENHAVP